MAVVINEFEVVPVAPENAPAPAPAPAEPPPIDPVALQQVLADLHEAALRLIAH